MARRTLPALFRSWAFNSRNLGRRSRDAVVLGLETFEDRVVPATIPTPTADPASVALPRIDPVQGDNSTPVDFINPQVVADPTNPQRQVLVATRVNPGGVLGAVYQYKPNDASPWSAASLFQRPRDPMLPANTNPNANYTHASSPAVAFGRDGTIYFVYLAHNAAKTSGAVLFTRVAFGGTVAGAPTVLYQWTGADPALNPTIGVDNNLPTYTDPVTGQVFTDTLTTRTVGRQSVYVAWNGNAANAADVTTSGGVLNFNPNPILAAVSADNGDTWTNPTPVTDGGYLGSLLPIVFPSEQRATAPQIAFSPGNSGAPGSLVFAWPRQVRGQNFSEIVVEATRPDGGSATAILPQAYSVNNTFTSTTGAVPDATAFVAPATSDTPSPAQTFPITIPAGTIADPAFVLRDLSINLSVVSPNLNHLRVELIAPNGTSLILFNNRTRGDNTNPPTPGGQPFPIGISVALPAYDPAANPLPANGGLGVVNGTANTRAVFSDTAARRVNDPASAYPFIGAYRPEGDAGYQREFAPTALIAQFLANAGLTGAGAAALNGSTWSIRITDFRDDRFQRNNANHEAAQFLQSFGLTFSSVADGFGTDTVIDGSVAPAIGTDFNNAPLTGASGVYPAVSPTAGVGASVSLAFDTSLGSSSPFGGSLYVAYTHAVLDAATPPRVTDTDIRIARGAVAAGAVTFNDFDPLAPGDQVTQRVNDDTAGDNWTEGNRPQFTPAVTVDPTTGTVVATWYDARLDANRTRTATFIATSIDGGASWSDQTLTTADTADTRTSPFLNEAKDAIDFVTGTRYTLQPVPTNITQAGALGVGIRQSVIASGGRVYGYWAGNLNAAGSGILSGQARFAGGPRVIGGDMGAILTASFSGAGPYNTAVAPDGTRGLDGFVVTFDRLVNEDVGGPGFPGSALNPANYVVRYHNPYDAVGIDTIITPTSVTAAGGNSFLVRFPARFEVGTYSYSVSNVRDRVRTLSAGGNPMDQDADSVVGEAAFDSFAMPTPLSGVPFTFPYAPLSLPLIIPGPYMVGSSVPNRSAADEDMVNSGVATAVDVRFDRDINVNPAAGPVFSRTNVVRITGPAGVLYDRSSFFGAAATAAVAGGQVTGVTINTNGGGGGYPAAPIVVLTGGGGTGAAAQATVVNGVVTGVTILTPGTGYTSPPTVTFLHPITVTQPNAADARTFRIGFPPQVLSGTYTVEVDAQFAGEVGLGAGRPVLIDSNQNAGVSVLKGGDPTAGVATNSNYNATFTGPAAVIPASVGGVPGQATFPLVVPDAFAIALSNGHVPSVLLNVSSAAPVNNRVIDLVGELIAPDGTVIRLFTNVGQATGRPLGTQWFANTTLIDTANSPIQGGFQPFSAGPYTPQFPLGDLAGKASNGTWRLRITNIGGQTPRLNAWALSLPQVSGGTGLGQDAADRFAVSFRVFNQDPTDPLTQQTWTAVGPAAENGQGNSSRTNGLAVDPSDPSGNTVYLGGASSGVWKTNNFLTMDPAGPTWVPLTDSGPTYSLNVVSIALFPRNNDPNQTIVFALTGEGDTSSEGVGILRSMDAGKTWNVLDSLNNTDVGGFGGNLTPITAASRDREFFRKTGFEIIVDPTPVADAEQNVVVYAAFGTRPGEVGGVYRSVDTGRHWTLMRAGNATDIVLAEGSGAVGTGLLQILYGAFRGEGVYRANPAFVAGGMVALPGTPTGNGSFVDGDTTLADRVEINAPVETPNGAKGRVLLATPARTNNRVQDLNYQGWLYALVVAPNDSFDGLYVTKDFGNNWTKVGLPELLVPSTGIPAAGYGTNNYTRNDHDVFASPPGTVGGLPGQGNYDVGFAIDPLNPNVVYIGGTNNNAIGPNGAMIRVDTTGLLDAGAVVAYDNSLPDGGTVQFTIGTGNVSTKAANTTSETTNADLGPGLPYGLSFPSRTGTNTGYLNVLRDPTNPFATSATFLAFTNVDRILNTGRGARYSNFSAEVQTDVHRIITMVDPLTGGTRLLVGDDQGIATAVDDGKGNLIFSVGTGPQRQNLPGLVRNGNLQMVQFYSSAVQPGQLAAEIAGAMFYGEAQDNGFPRSVADILQTGVGASGNLSWNGGGGDGSWGMTDQTGTGAYYDYKWPCCGGGGENFFQVNDAGRTNGLTQPNDNPTVGTGNWNITGGPKFAVNPIDPNGILMSSAVTGRLFRTVDQGVTWFQVAGADPGPAPNAFTLFQNLGGYAPAVAFGAPDVNETQAQFNNFLYAGVGGTVWVSFNGGTTWTALPAVSGSVQQIVPDPARGSKALYVVTSSGVFFKASSQTAAAWTNITGNIFTITDPIFSDPNAPPQGGVPATIRGLTSLAVDWRYAIPDTRPNAPSPFFPILYAGGYGGIVRSLDRGQTWQIYPVGSSYAADYVDQTTGRPGTVVTAIPNGGYFPSAEVTQLSLSFGNIDPTTGLPLQGTGGLNMLTAATYGRGTWVIRLEDLRTNANPAIAALADFQVIQQSGPKVIGVGGTGVPNEYVVEFDAPVLATTFTPADFRMTDSAGNPVRVVAVEALPNNVAPFGAPALPVAANDYHNLFRVTVAPVTSIAAGFARVTIGPDAANPGRASIADYAGFGMNQDGDNRNGETAADPNNGGAAADAYSGFVFVPATTDVVADFSDGAGGLSLDGFTATGLWHPTAAAPGAALPGHTAPEIAYYGIDATGTYDTGAANSGTLTSGPILLPTGNVALTFNYRLQSEGGNPFDLAAVQVSTDGTNFGTVASNGIGNFGNTLAWTAASVDLSAFAGQTVFVRFRFDTVDDIANSTLGWQIDDVAVASAPAGVVFGNLHLNMPVVATAGDPTQVVVTAINPATGLPDPGYTGTVHFDVANDPLLAAAGLPADYTFTASDNGVHSFTIIFKTATAPSGPLAPQTLLSVSDTLGNTNPARARITVNPGLATHFRVAGFPDPTVAGAAGSFTVTALDLFDNVDPTYAGTVTFTSTDLGASTVLPAPYTFDPAVDAGVHTFTDELTLTVAGLQTITATDDTNPNRLLTGDQTVLVVPAAPAAVLLSGLPATTVAGTALTVTVRLEDEFGNLATNYTGTVSFTSTDAGLMTQLPPTYTFTSGVGAGFDNGVHTFTNEVTLTTVRTTAPGTQSVTVTTGTTPAVSATQAVQVTPAAPTQVFVTGFPNPVTAGVFGSVTVTLRDPFNNLATNFTGAVTFTSSDLGVSTVLPPTYTFTSGPGRDNGVHVFTNGVRLTTAGLQSITASIPGPFSGSQLNIQVNAAAAASLAVTGFPASVVAGTPGTVTVTLRDQFQNLATGFAGTVTFTSTDANPATVLPGAYTFTAGDGGTRTFTNGVTLTTATGTTTFPGTHAVTATAGALTGNQSGIVVTPAATARYTVAGYPSPVTAGTVGSVTVTARDQFGNVTPAYTGTVTFASTDAGVSTQLPLDYTFTAGDGGVHLFNNEVRLTIAGTQSITATDTANALITGTQAPILVTAAAANSLTVTGFPTPVTAGVPGSVTVTLRDQFGNLATGFTGAVAFTSTDAGTSTVLPPTYTFTGADGGTRTFTNGVTLTTATGTATFPGTHSITATATATPALTGNQGGIVVTPAATSQFVVAGFPTPVAAGAAGTITVTARDRFGNLTPAYAGTVRFTSTDIKPSTVLPPDYTFLPGTDAGVHTFTNGVTLTTAGTQSITARDTVNATITGTQTGIVVTPGAATQLTVAGFPTTVTAGVPGSITVTLLDQFGNRATGYVGTVSFTSTDPAVTAVVPAAYVFTAGDAGVHVFTNGVRLTTATGTPAFPGTHTITATDSVLTGSQSGVTVTPAAPAQVAVTGFPATVVAGTPGSVTVTLRDQFNNLATNYTGTVSFASTDAGAGTVLPPVYTFTGGDAGVHTFTNGVTLTTAGTHAITATAGSASGSQTGITVTPDATSQFVVGGFPGTVTAGTPGTLTVTARDRFGNLTPAFAGTVTVTSTDVGASTVLPAPYTFVPGTDAGAHTFTGVTLTTAGTQSLTAAAGAISGTQAGILVTPAAVASAAVTGFPATVTAGVPGSVTVTLRDTFGNLATNYTGTVSFTSTDTGAQTVLPSVYTFTAGDAGAHTFTNGVTLTTAGTQSITATAGAVSGSQTGITVTPDAASRFVVGGFPTPVVAGTPAALTVTARDRFGNTATGYTGTVRFSSTDTGPNTVLPGNYPFTALDAGVHTFPGVRLTTVGTRSITATDTVTATVAGTQAGIVVTPAAAASLAVTGFPTAITAGTPGTVTVTLRDQFNNLATGFTGTVTFSSSDTGASTALPAAYTFTAGDGGVRTFTNGVTLTTAGAQSVGATSGALSGSQGGITVTPAGAARVVVGGLPARVAAGTRSAVTVTALDAFGNTATGYGGPLSVTSSDPRAQFPASVALAGGVGTFDAVFNTRSVQTLRAADPANGALAGQATTDVFFNLAQTFAVGGGTGGSQTVFEYDGTGNPTAAFPNRYGGGSRVVSADFNGDGVPDLAVGAGPGIPSDITVFDGRTKAILFTANPFEGFSGGVFLAAGNVSGTGRPELIVTPDQGGGPRVQVYAGGTFTKIADFFGIEDSSFRGGARAAAGDIDGDGFAEVVVSAGFQGGPRISVYDGAALSQGRIVHPMSDFFAFEPTLRNGAFVAVGDVNGDGFGDMIFGAGPGGGPRVLIVSGQTVMQAGAGAAIAAPIANLFAGNPDNRGGVRVTAKNLDGDGFADLVVGDGEGAGSTVTAYKGSNLSANRTDPLFLFDAFPGINAGVFVG